MHRAALDAADVEELLRGGSVWKPISGHVVLRDAYQQPDAAWELLLQSGYLNSVEERAGPTDRIEHRLCLPNKEVTIAFEDAVRQWSQIALGGGARLDHMLEAMLAGDVEEFEYLLGNFARDALSYLDTPREISEGVFHTFLLGMLVQLAPRYRVTSNREAGYGRADLLIAPRERGGAGVVIELKRVRAGQDPAVVLEAALGQIAERGYAEELRAQGCAEVLGYAAAVEGKRVWVRMA